MAHKEAILDVGFIDDERVLGYVDVAYTNAYTFDAAATLRAALTAGKAAAEREEHNWKCYPPERHPHVERAPFVVEAHGRLGAEVLPFLRQHAPAGGLLRSAVLSRATREISIITQRDLAALLCTVEPRPSAV